MTPAARVQAAIEILDVIATGQPAEKALTGWARRSRFAGSGDRAAIRDHVFQALRCWRSYACLGGADTGRGRMIGSFRDQNIDPGSVFTGQGHAPMQLTETERHCGETPQAECDRLDIPGWLLEKLRASLGDSAEPTAMKLRERAPIMVRVNLAKSTPDDAIIVLARDGIEAIQHSISSTALKITQGARKIAQSDAFRTGLVEMQDGSSQAAMETVDLTGAKRVLDYCAGGGGKTLALAARSQAAFYAYDADVARMKDLPLRAERADVDIQVLSSDQLQKSEPYDVVLCDVPCSGSGTWRRAPDEKWKFSPERLAELNSIQDEILTKAKSFTAPRGAIVYATCSVLKEENIDRVQRFVELNSGEFTLQTQEWPVSDAGDGFFVAHLKREC